MAKSSLIRTNPAGGGSSLKVKKLMPTPPAALFLCALLAMLLPASAQTRVAGRLLVKPKARLSAEELDQRLAPHGLHIYRTLHRSPIRVVNVAEERLPAVVAKLQSDPEIEFVEPDYVATAAYAVDDPKVQSGEAWHLAKVQAVAGWDYTTGNPNVIVAVLDSGVTAGNADLLGRVLPGYDFVNGDADVTDDFGHGTAVTGTIVAAGNNNVGTAGVAFGCRVLPVKVMGPTGYAYYSAVAEGIRYAVDNGARVINISIAGDTPSATLQDAIDYAWNHNVVIVAAAGNNGNSVPQYPAACDHVIAVGATDNSDLLASFSSYGSHVQLTAPGVSIWTTQRYADNPFGTWRGTSFASPLVAGAAALLASARPELSNTEITTLLAQTADDLGPAGRDDVYGYGRVNVLKALIASGATVTPPPTPSSPPAVALNCSGTDQRFDLGQSIALTAEATSAAGIQAVEVYANDIRLLGFTTPPYTFDWQPAVAGNYSLTAVAVDLQGQRGTSAPVQIQVVSSGTTATLRIAVIGDGRVGPALDGRALEIGKTYTVRAKAGKDQIFAGWEGIESNAATLTFTMRKDLELTARFVPSPFVNLAGNFQGLIAGPNGVTPESSGAFTLTLNRLGGFSGKLQLAGRSHGFRGQFDLQGQASITVLRQQAAPVRLDLTLDLANGGTQISGQVGSGGWSSELRGNRNLFNPVYNPAPQAGYVNFVLEGESPQPTTVATGANKISTGGNAAARGTLQDGRKFARAAALSHQGDFPFYLSLASGQEVVIGWVNFSAQSTAAASGTVVWARSGTNAFATTLQATGMR